VRRRGIVRAKQAQVGLLVLVLLSLFEPLALAQHDSPGLHGNSAGNTTGRIEGLVTFSGKIPKSAVADDAGERRELLRVDPRTRGVKDVVVWLTPAGQATQSVAVASNTAPAVMDQLDHEFLPRVLAVVAGQPVKFSNSDPANHNVRTMASVAGNHFNVFTGPDGSYTHRFAVEPGHQPVRTGCDIHPWMRGWIYVFEHPCFAVTDERGRFEIGGVPVGRYKLQYRQPDIRAAGERDLVIAQRRAATVQIEIFVAAPGPERGPE
jgi:plastocyanin